MKKIVLFLSLCTLFSSCQVSFGTFMKYLPEVVKEINYVSKETRMEKKTETTYHYGKKSSFVFENGRIYIPCKINDTIQLVLYDTDNLTSNFQEKIPGNIEFPKTEKTVKVRTILPGVTMKRGLQYYNIESDFFDLKKYPGRITSLSNDTITPICGLRNSNNTFNISMNIFPKWNDIMLLNFSDTTITLLNHYAAFLDGVDTYDTTGFTSVKSLFTCQGLILWLTIDSIEYKLVFSTMYDEFLFLPQYEPHKKDDDIFIVRYGSKNTIDTLINQKSSTIKMEDLDSISGDIFYAKNKTYQAAIGMKFISQYDWIIDMNDEGKVYAKKIKNAQNNNWKNYHQVNIVDSTLRITLLPAGEEKYQLYSIIDSVNREKVNMDNICQMRRLLNKENGFKDNEIVILPPLKPEQMH